MKKNIKLNNSDNSLDIYLSKNNTGQYENEDLINKNYIIENNYYNQYFLGINSPYQEEINTKEDIIQTNDEDELENLGTGKFRFINTQAEKEIKNKRNKYLNDNTNYLTQNIYNKRNSNNSNSKKETNNICVVINKPKTKYINKNKTINYEYLNIFKEEENNNMKDKRDYKDVNHRKNNKSYEPHNSRTTKRNKLYEPVNSRFTKRNMSYESRNSNSSKRNKRFPIDYIKETDNYIKNSYLETDPNDKNKKMSFHQKLKQKEQTLKDLKYKILTKNNYLKDKQSMVNKNEKPILRSSSYDRGRNIHIKNNDLKEESIIDDSSVYRATQRKAIKNIKNNNRINYNSNLQNNSINSLEQIFNDMPIIKRLKPKYKHEEDNIYKTISSDTSKDRYDKSFNKSIEEKRKLLGIPLYKNEFQKNNKRTKNDISDEEKQNINNSILYKKKQDETLRNYEKKNSLNQNSRNKIPIRITYKKKNPINIFENYKYNNIENKNNKKIDKNDSKLNNSYIIQSSGFNDKNIRNSNRTEIFDNSCNDIDPKIEDNIYLKKRIIVYRQKDKSKNFKKNMTNDNNINNKDLFEFKNIPYSINEPKEDRKVYDNALYISQNFFNENENEFQKNNSNIITNSNNDNRNIINLKNNIKYNKVYSNQYIKNPKDISQNGTKPINDETMKLPMERDIKIIHVIKKRHKSPNKTQIQLEINKNNQNQNSYIGNIYIKNQEKEKELNNVQNKENRNIITAPGRGIAALRRINQRIDNYKKGINSIKRKKVKNNLKKKQYKSLSLLKKIGIYFKKNKSNQSLTNVNNKLYQNFDFINDL